MSEEKTEKTRFQIAVEKFPCDWNLAGLTSAIRDIRLDAEELDVYVQILIMFANRAESKLIDKFGVADELLVNQVLSEDNLARLNAVFLNIEQLTDYNEQALAAFIRETSSKVRYKEELQFLCGVCQEIGTLLLIETSDHLISEYELEKTTDDHDLDQLFSAAKSTFLPAPVTKPQNGGGGSERVIHEAPVRAIF